jgi:cation:H+ antiporter
MQFLDFSGYPLWLNFAVFAASAVVVWIAGTRIARYADKIAIATGIGHAAAGLVLLAGITSLPEVAVSVSSAATGNPAMAVNNLLGSIAMQIAILAVADAVMGKRALTVVVGSSVVLLQVAMNTLLLTLFATAVTVGDTALLHIGAWSWGLLGMYVFSIWKIANSQDRHLWVAQKTAQQKERAKKEAAERKRKDARGNMQQADGGADADEEIALKPLLVKTAIGAAAILIAGFLLSRTGDAIATKTGLGQSFVGAVLIAISTSLPEVSSVVSAVKLGRFEMAISDIFGTNLFNIGLVFLVDVAYSKGPVINEVATFSQLAALIGALLAAIYMIGLLERRDRTVAKMGVDSIAVLFAYIGGLFLLYQFR